MLWSFTQSTQSAVQYCLTNHSLLHNECCHHKTIGYWIVYFGARVVCDPVQAVSQFVKSFSEPWWLGSLAWVCCFVKGKQASSMKRKRTGHFEKDDGYLWLLIINHFSFSLEYESFWNKDRPMKQLQPKGLDNHIENTLQIQEKINKTNKRDRITELFRHKYLICRWSESRMRKRQYCWTGYQTFLLSKKKKDKEFTGVEHVAADESLIMFKI